MGIITNQEQINIDLFDEMQRMKKEYDKLEVENAHLKELIKVKDSIIDSDDSIIDSMQKIIDKLKNKLLNKTK